TNNLVMNEMKHRFKPEFLTRVEDIIIFKPLDQENNTKIIDISMKDLKHRLKEKYINIKSNKKL
ncbi:hypothetical protein, partial [Clostridioides difficile]|uniref:hypothetical protein n=1 Tax=Clostridioides difficile TaxID=1496 RepID=UPI00117AB0B1